MESKAKKGIIIGVATAVVGALASVIAVDQYADHKAEKELEKYPVYQYLKSKYMN